MVSNFQTYRVWIQIVGTPPQVCHPERPYLRDQLTPPPRAPINYYYYSFLLLFFKLLSQGPCAVRKSERKRNYIELCDKSYAGGYLGSRYNFLFHKGVKGLARVTQPLIKNMMSTQACLSQRLHHSTLFDLLFNFMKSLNLPSIAFFLLHSIQLQNLIR